MVTFMKENIIASNLQRKIIVNLKLINHKKKILLKKTRCNIKKDGTDHAMTRMNYSLRSKMV
jgi:hypothetical protein